MAEDRKNSTLHRAGFVPAPQSTCPIATGEAGLWYDSTNSVLKLRNADGTDTKVQALVSGLKLLAFTGRNGAGTITLTGAAVGDKVIGLIDTAAGSVSAAASFASSITVANQIAQSSASDLSSTHFVVLLQSA